MMLQTFDVGSIEVGFGTVEKVVARVRTRPCPPSFPPTMATVTETNPRATSIQLDIPDLSVPRNSIPIKKDPKGRRVYLNNLFVFKNGRIIFGIACITQTGEHLSMEESKAMIATVDSKELRDLTIDCIKVGYDRIKSRVAVAGSSRQRGSPLVQSLTEEEKVMEPLEKVAIEDGENAEEKSDAKIA